MFCFFAFPASESKRGCIQYGCQLSDWEGGGKEREKHHFGSCYIRKADGGKQREEVANKRGGCVRGRWQPAEEPLPACDTRRFQNHHLTFPRSASALSPPSSLNRSVTQLYSLPPPSSPVSSSFLSLSPWPSFPRQSLLFRRRQTCYQTCFLHARMLTARSTEESQSVS